MQKCKERFAYREKKNIVGRGATMNKRIAALRTRMYLVIVSAAEAYRLLVPLNSMHSLVNVELTIIPRVRVGYEITVDSQRGA